ncbi:hypothetical protein, partial [Klebsiella pneumoniae]
VKFKNTTGSTQLSGMRFEKLESSYHMDGAEFLFIDKGVHKDISGEIIKITNKDKIRLNSSLIERQVYQGNQQPSLFDAQYTSSIANTTNHGIHWLDGNKQVIE